MGKVTGTKLTHCDMNVKIGGCAGTMKLERKAGDKTEELTFQRAPRYADPERDRDGVSARVAGQDGLGDARDGEERARGEGDRAVELARLAGAQRP